jgi:cation-transporting ATPase E
MTTAAILCGVILIVFAQPPTQAFGGGAEVNGDWRPTILAGAMVAMYAVILKVHTLRTFYEMKSLTVLGYVFIAAVVLAWAYLLREFWRVDLPELARRLWRYLTADG